MGFLETFHKFSPVSEVHDQLRIRTLIAHVRLVQHGNSLLRDSLLQHFHPAFPLQPGKYGLKPSRKLIGKHGSHIVFLYEPLVSQPHAVCRKDTGKGVDENALHPQGICNPADVLASCSSETAEGVFFYVVPPLDRDFLDGVCHILHSHGKEAFSNLFHAPGTARTCSHSHLRAPPGKS